MTSQLESLLDFFSIPLKREWRLKLLGYGFIALALSLALPWYFVIFTASSTPIPGMGVLPGSEFHVVFGWNQGNVTFGSWLHVTPDHQLREATLALKLLTAVSLLAWLEANFEGRLSAAASVAGKAVGRFLHAVFLIGFLVLVWQRTHLWDFATQYRVAAFEAFGKGATGAALARRIYAIPFLGVLAPFLGSGASLLGLHSRDATPKAVEAAVAARRFAGKTLKVVQTSVIGGL